MAKKEDLKLNDKVKFDNKGGAILGVLEGPCADIMHPTRNNRKYAESLWNKVLAKDTVKEMFANGGIPGELDHPGERQEICSEKIAILMPEPPKKDATGKLIGKFNILDTPCGRIAYTLAKAGFKLGISSRGNGEVIDNYDGTETVDEDTYDFVCFDLVLLPAVENARLKLVTESIDTKKKVDYKKALNEALSKANDDERLIMEETLSNLNIDYKSAVTSNIDESISEEVDTEKSNEAVDDGALELIRSLQEALKSKSELEVRVVELQNMIAVSDTKVTKLNEELSKYKGATIQLSATAFNSKKLKEENLSLKEKLDKAHTEISSQRQQIKQLVESKRVDGSKYQSLNENIQNKDSEIKQLYENLDKQKTTYETRIKKLTEQFEKEKANIKLRESENSKKLSKAKTLLEKYKEMTYATVSRYIESKASLLGISPNEIKNRLDESYTLDDIDKICEDLQTFNLNMSKLPFNIDKRNIKVKVNESKNDGLKIKNNEFDDEVDDSLLRMASINKKYS